MRHDAGRRRNNNSQNGPFSECHVLYSIDSLMNQAGMRLQLLGNMRFTDASRHCIVVQTYHTNVSLVAVERGQEIQLGRWTLGFAAMVMVRHMLMPPLNPFDLYAPPEHDRQ